MPAPAGTRLKQRRRGTWYILYTGNSRGVSTGTMDRAEAEVALAKFIADRANSPEAKGRLTVAHALRDYEIEHVHKCAAPTLERHRLNHLRAHFGGKIVMDIVQADVDSYCAKRKSGEIGQPSNSATARRELGLLRAAIRHHLERPVAERLLSRDHVPHFDLPPMSPPRELWLERADLAALLRACFPGDRGTWQQAMDGMGREERLSRAFRFIVAAYETASRPQAVQDLQWGQIRRAEGWIDLNPPGRTQTRKRRPRVPIGDMLAPVLAKAWESSGGFTLYLDHAGGVRRIFLTVARRAAATLAAQAAVAHAEGRHDDAAALNAAAGRIGRSTPYTLRHTKATHMAQGGASMKDIADMLGDTVETVEKNYIHHSPDYLREAVNAGR